MLAWSDPVGYSWGTYHIAQPDVIHWHGFADVIFKEARKKGVVLSLERLNEITTRDYPTPAKRPQNSALDCTTLEEIFNLTIKPWRGSLAEVIEGLQHV